MSNNSSKPSIKLHASTVLTTTVTILVLGVSFYASMRIVKQRSTASTSGDHPVETGSTLSIPARYVDNSNSAYNNKQFVRFGSESQFSVEYPGTWEVQEYVDTDNSEGVQILSFDTKRMGSGYLPSVSTRTDWSVEKEIERIKSSSAVYKIRSEDTSIGGFPARRLVYSSDIGIDFEETVVQIERTSYIFKSLKGDLEFKQLVNTFSKQGKV